MAVNDTFTSAVVHFHPQTTPLQVWRRAAGLPARLKPRKRRASS
jgi:hypothetical protein